MTSRATSYSDWKAPREDGQILIWPEPIKLLSDTTENQKRLSGASETRVQGVALSELRRRARQWIGHDDAQPLIADGHQTELHHPGVWAKRALTHHAAVRLSGSAMHFAVDTDAPKHLTLKTLTMSEPITDDPNVVKAHWVGTIDAPSPAHLSKLDAQVNEPLVRDLLVSLRRLSIEQPLLSPALTNAMHELDWSLGLRHHALLASPVWGSEAFLIFLHHVVARAGEFAAQYNAALAGYRREKKIRSTTRPMPDLSISDDAVELPFWLDELATGQRTRPSAFARDGGFVLIAPGGDEFDFNPNAEADHAIPRLTDWLRRNQLRLSPRALVLTMFLRLCVVDQFVHGIGGGQYDQVTDRIIASHFGIEPPRFSVATATMYLPQATERSQVCVRCVLQEGHRLKHSLLGARKEQLIAQIDASPRNSPERYAAFATMHRELSAAAVNSPVLQKWETRLAEATTREAEESLLFDRELFYAIQPRNRLEEMISRFAI